MATDYDSPMEEDNAPTWSEGEGEELTPGSVHEQGAINTDDDDVSPRF